MSEAVSQLQSQVTELQKENEKLQKRIRNQDEQLQKADELNQEMLELRPKHWLTTEELRIKNEQLQLAETENQRLKQENIELQNKVCNSLAPDYEATRDRVLNKLKVGRQSPSGKAINVFIKELQQTSKPIKSSPVTAASLISEAYSRYEQSGFVNTDVYDNALRRIAVLCGLKVLQSINGKSFWITPINEQGQKLTTSSNIYGIAEFLKTQPLLEAYAGKWLVGDKCNVKMPSGVTVTDAVIVSIQPDYGSCKVHVPDTESHFSADLAALERP